MSSSGCYNLLFERRSRKSQAIFSAGDSPTEAGERFWFSGLFFNCAGQYLSATRRFSKCDTLRAVQNFHRRHLANFKLWFFIMIIRHRIHIQAHHALKTPLLSLGLLQLLMDNHAPWKSLLLLNHRVAHLPGDFLQHHPRVVQRV